MNYLKNAWYPAAWSTEVGAGQLFARTLLDEPVLIFRKTDGAVSAMLDRCPHRFVPLHRGRLVGDSVECGYHGLTFDCSGQCVGNPFNGVTPRSAQVKTFPVVEKHKIVWAWMGEPALAGAAPIPDFAYLDDPALGKVPGYKHVKANYELLVDNVADLSHTHVLHRSNLGSVSVEGEHVVKQEGDTVYSKFAYPGIKIPPMYARYLGDPDAIVDRWTEIMWNPPANIRLDAGVTPTGQPRAEGAAVIGTHLFTPETATSTHYFYCHVRNFKVDDAATEESIRTWQREAFHGEDAPMIEAQQASMGDRTDLLAMKPVLLASDAGAVRIRRTLSALIDREAAEQGVPV